MVYNDKLRKEFEKYFSDFEGYAPVLLKMMREVADISQRELAYILGVSHSAVSMAESGAKLPNARLLLGYSYISGWPMTAFNDFNPKVEKKFKNIDPKLEKMIKDLFSSEEQELIADTIEKLKDKPDKDS